MPYMKWKIKNVWNHQPDSRCQSCGIRATFVQLTKLKCEHRWSKTCCESKSTHRPKDMTGGGIKQSWRSLTSTAYPQRSNTLNNHQKRITLILSYERMIHVKWYHIVPYPDISLLPYLSTYMLIYMSELSKLHVKAIYLSTSLSVCLSISLPLHRSIDLSISLSLYRSISLSIYISHIYQYIDLSIYLNPSEVSMHNLSIDLSMNYEVSI